MNTEITATHESGTQTKIIRKPENVERTVKLMEQSGYTHFTFKVTSESSKSGM
jgi:hypothetical protein